jgi:hypothetical protein
VGDRRIITKLIWNKLDWDPAMKDSTSPRDDLRERRGRGTYMMLLRPDLVSFFSLHLAFPLLEHGTRFEAATFLSLSTLRTELLRVLNFPNFVTILSTFDSLRLNESLCIS